MAPGNHVCSGRCNLLIRCEVNGRGGGIRTPDPLLPKQMRYQATLRPDRSIVPQPSGSGMVA
jgi:hypothetical protein